MNHKIITIARQFGSGGHEIAQRTAELLDVYKRQHWHRSSVSP